IAAKKFFLPICISILVPKQQITSIHWSWINSVMLKCSFWNLKVLLGVEQIQSVGHRRYSAINACLKCCFSRHSFLSGNQHYPVGTPGTVYSSSIGILQNLNTLNIGKINSA